MSEIEATISRISSYEGVDRILIIKSIETEDSINSIVMRSMVNSKKTELKSLFNKHMILELTVKIRN